MRFDVCVIFFFSSRRRHTRSLCDWSSDVCSSDLETVPPEYRSGIGDEGTEAIEQFVKSGGTLVALNHACNFALEKLGLKIENRSEERRVGKECRSRWARER